MKNKPTLSLLSREEFKKALNTPLGQHYMSRNPELLEKIHADDYYGSDDLYCINIKSEDDYSIALMRLHLSILVYAEKCIEAEPLESYYAQKYHEPLSTETALMAVGAYTMYNVPFYSHLQRCEPILRQQITEKFDCLHMSIPQE